MKIKLYFDKGNLGRLAVAMIFAAVLFWKDRLFGVGAAGIRSVLLPI